MKTILPFLLLTALTINAQTQINRLNGNLIPVNGTSSNGSDYRYYVRYDPATVFDQSSAGFDKVWDISGFTALEGLKIYNNTAPTPEELSEYPETKMVTMGAIVGSPGEILDKTYVTNTLANITGFANTIFLLYYTLDDAEYGSFPMLYGDLHVDTVAGNYSYGEYSGTFDGTIITEVDAYGNMITATDGTLPVTRLKTVITLQLYYPEFGAVGTFVQTTYRYYRQNDLWPFVKSTDNVIHVDLLGINKNTTNIEKAPATFLLSLQEPVINSQFTVYPNPVSDIVDIMAPGQTLISVTITDILGKEIFTKKETTHLDLSTMQSGTYFARIKTEQGTSVKKIVKK